VLQPKTLFDKIWSRHAILEREDGATLLFIDRLLVHEGSRRSFKVLHDKGLRVRRPDCVFGTPDHYAPTTTRNVAEIDQPERRAMVESLSANAQAEGFALFGLDDPRQGIVHVIGPEQGITLPGITLVCGDSHTATHGAFGALAFGIGSSEGTHVLATQTLWQRKPKRMRITIDGRLSPGIVAKDIILTIIAKITASGAGGYAIEYAGSTIRDLSPEGRLTICNMSIEAGAKFGMIAPDETIYAYLKDRPYAPRGENWEQATAYWRTLPSDPEAVFDREVVLDAAEIEPMVTWGTSPEDATPVTGSVPDPSNLRDSERRSNMLRALDYMGLEPGMRLADLAFDRVFIGSCTNSRIEDLRAASKIALNSRAVIPALVVPGSGLVKRQAEAEGLDRIFKDAGFQWGEAGCSMCVAMNGDIVAPRERCASTSNRNFIGRQGPGARTHLMSPAMAAAVAVSGKLVDIRELAGASYAEG